MTSTLTVADRRRAALERRTASTAPVRAAQRVKSPRSTTDAGRRRPLLQPARHVTKSAWRTRPKLGPPPGTFYVIAGIVAVFVMLGLVMVLSASAITQVNVGNSPYAVFGRQAMWAGFGLVGMIDRKSVV